MIVAKDGGTDNLATCTATALQFLDPDEKSVLRKRFIDYMRACEIEPGLYTRRPNDPRENSVDNLVGVIALSYGLETDHRFDIVRYAESHSWNFNSTNPGVQTVKSNFGKFGGIPPLLSISIGRDIPLYDQAILAGSVDYTALSDYGNTSDKCLQLLANPIIDARYTLCSLGLWAWKKMMKKKYPRGQRELYEIYWGLSHPYTLAAPETF